MNKLIPIAMILGLLLGISTLAPAIMASPNVKRSMDLYDITIQGGNPQTVDYSWAYDTASGEIVQNTMDTLLMWNTESSSPPYLPAIATSWTDFQLGGAGGIMSNDPIDGLNFENSAQPGPNATYYWRYDFKIKQGVQFQAPYNYSLTPEDVAYSFQRTILMDRTAGPQWMLQEPLLDTSYGLNWGAGYYGGIGEIITHTYHGHVQTQNVTQIDEIAALVRDAVGYNATDVWFNIMFPGAYAPFYQILAQTWGAIESKQWINNQVIGSGRKDFSGSFSNLTAWIDTWNPVNSPLDKPSAIEYGSGPFTLTTVDYTNNFWSATRNVNWWGGWPAFYPTEAGVQTAGYADTIEVSWNYAWAAAKAYFLAGDCDFVALPALSNMPEIYKGATGSYYPYPSTSTNLPKDGLRCFAPLPTLICDGLFFTYNITTSTYSGTIYAPVNGAGNYPSGDAGGIPSNFFGDSVTYGNPYGISMRKAFAYSVDYAQELAVAALGEGIIPATAIISGLYGYNASIVGYSYNLTLAKKMFDSWPGLNTTGFTITLVYNSGNGERQELCDLIAAAVHSINPLYVVHEVPVDWNSYLTAAVYQELSCFVIGWQVDFPDPHDFALPFYHTYGAFAAWQLYSNTTMDAMIDEAITLPNGNPRLELYSRIAQLAIEDCPSVTVLQGTGRHFEYDWVQGWYYDPIYPGHNFYNEYKFYYVPESNQGTQAQPFSEYLPADVNHDGTVNMKDISTIARAFGSSYTQPITSNWVFVDDLTNDRTINMKDIAFVARQFGTVSPIGTWGPLVTITPITSTLAPGGSIAYKATVDAFHGNATGRVIQWYYGTLINGQEGAPTAGGTGATWTFSSIPAGSSYVFCTVKDVFTGNTARANAGYALTVTVESMHAGIYASV